MNSTLLSNEASVDLQVRLQFEFEAGLGRDLQVLLNHCYCRIENTRTANPRTGWEHSLTGSRLSIVAEGPSDLCIEREITGTGRQGY